MNFQQDNYSTSGGTKYLELNITERCNLKCIYCYQNGGRKKYNDDISFEIATETIRDHLTREDEFDDVCINLIGGEIFLCWPLVRDIISWTLEKSQEWKKKFVFFLDTNGTLLTDEIKDWLSARRNKIYLGLSLDGTPAAHNLNRSGSYSLIEPHIPFFAENWPTQPVKMTISPQTIPMIFDGVIHIMNQGLCVSANVVMENVWGSKNEKQNYIKMFKEEIEKLVDYFGRHLDFPLPSIIDLPIQTITSEKAFDRPWCGSGRNMIAVDTNGNSLPCIRYSRMSFDQNLFNEPLTSITSSCCDCLFKPACQTCEVNNWQTNGNPNARTTFHCEFSKIQIWGTAQVHTKRLENRIHEIERMSEKKILKHTHELLSIENHLLSIAKVLEALSDQNLANPASFE